MKLVSMKLSKSEAKSDSGLSIEAPSLPKYPYGLELRLNRDQLDKLKFDPDVDTEVTIEARGVVTMYRESQRQGKEPDCSAEIQITDLAISESPKARKERKGLAHLDEISNY